MPEGLSFVDDVHAGIGKYLREHFGLWFFVPAALTFLIGPIILFADLGNFDPFLAYSVVPVFGISLVTTVGMLYQAYRVVREAFMRQFAVANGFAYKGNYPVNAMPGVLFNRGHSRSASFAVTGMRNEHVVWFFFYTYQIGSGKHKTTYEYTGAEIRLHGKTPDIVVESLGDFDLTSYAKRGLQEVLAESAFRDSFRIFASKDLEIEALEIFTPEVMSVLLDQAKLLNFEFVEDRVLIFRKGYITHRTELDELLRVVDYLASVVAPRIPRIQDDVAALNRAFGREPKAEAS